MVSQLGFQPSLHHFESNYCSHLNGSKVFSISATTTSNYSDYFVAGIRMSFYVFKIMFLKDILIQQNVLGRNDNVLSVYNF